MRKNSVSSLFLMELIIAIFFFSLASTVCIQLFVQSHLISKESVNLNHAVMNVQNFAEAYNGYDADINSVATAISEYAIVSGNSIDLFFDKDWNSISSDQQNIASFLITLTNNSQNGIYTAYIDCTDLSTNKVLFHLTCDKHIFQED